MAVNALNVPATGWVTTTCCASKILPPPTGMSPADTVTGPAAGRGRPDELAEAQAASAPAATAPTPTAAAPARTARRLTAGPL